MSYKNFYILMIAISRFIYAGKVLAEYPLFTVWKVIVFGVFLVHISRIRPEYGEIRIIFPYSVQMRENTNQKNSEYGHFSRSDCEIH